MCAPPLLPRHRDCPARPRAVIVARTGHQSQMVGAVAPARNVMQLKSTEEGTASVGSTQVPIITENKKKQRKDAERKAEDPSMSRDRSDELGSV